MNASKQHSTKRGSAAKHSGNGHKKRTHLERIDWEFRRLRNQALKFFGAQSAERRAMLKIALARAQQWSDVERIIKGLTAQRGRMTFRSFMNEFFSHRINKRIAG